MRVCVCLKVIEVMGGAPIVLIQICVTQKPLVVRFDVCLGSHSAVCLQHISSLANKQLSVNTAYSRVHTHTHTVGEPKVPQRFWHGAGSQRTHELLTGKFELCFFYICTDKSKHSHELRLSHGMP